MKNIKSYELFESKLFDKPHEKVGRFRGKLQKLMGKDYSQKADFKWEINNDDIKIFFDITDFFDPDQTIFGRSIIAWEAVKNWLKFNFKKTLNVVDHVGFIFKNGDVLHATESKGVHFEENYQDIQQNPHRFVIYRIPSKIKENRIRELGQELVTRLKETKHKSTYDVKGLARHVLPTWISKIFVSEKDDEQYFCSELVSNLLNKAGILSIDQLRRVYERSEIDTYDEISPQKLFKLITEIGKPAKVRKLTKGEQNKQLRK